MNPRAIIVPLALVASLGVAACGGGDKKLSKADLGKKASAICKDSAAEGKKIDQPANLTEDPVAAGEYFDKVLPIAEKQTSKFEDLKPNDDAKADWDQLLARQKQEVETVKIIRDKAKAKDRSGLDDLARLRRIDAKFVVEAKAVDADGCAE